MEDVHKTCTSLRYPKYEYRLSLFLIHSSYLVSKVLLHPALISSLPTFLCCPGRQSETLTRQFEEEHGKVKQLKLDMEALKQRSKKEREKAEKMAQGQRDALEREYSERMIQAEKAVSHVLIRERCTD